MQTMLYAYFFQFGNSGNMLPLKPGIFNIKEIYNPKFNPFLILDGMEVQNYFDFREEFESGLANLLAEIFDPSTPFSQTGDVKKCEYCAYKEICGR